MAKQDILLYNSTSSRFETNTVGSNTVRIKGDSSTIFNIQSGSTDLFKVDTSNPGVTFAATITASGDFSASLGSTASFGAVQFSTITGNSSQLTNVPTSDGSISSSVQLSGSISGAFDSGFIVDGTISGSATSTGSFGYIYAGDFDVGSAAGLIGLENVSESLGTLSGSTQIATDISGAFDSGFALESGSIISGSATSTASLDYITAGEYTVSTIPGNLTNYIPSGTPSSSMQISASISGSFNKGFALSGSISGSSTSTGSFGLFYATNYHGDGADLVNINEDGHISGAAQLASDISASFQSGFILTGSVNISGSSTTTASINHMFANKYEAILGSRSVSGITNVSYSLGILSGSGQIAAGVSGSFTKGFMLSSSYDEDVNTKISGSATSTASLGTFETSRFQVEEITITGSAVKIPVFSSTFNVDTRNKSIPEARRCFPTYGSGSYLPFENTNEYIGANTVGQLFVTNDGRLNFTYPSASVGYNPDSSSSGSYGSWTTAAGFSQMRCKQALSGTQYAALMFGGSANHTEEYDGRSWSEASNLISYRCNLWGAGSVNATLAGAGYNPGASTCTEEYNGTTWAVGGALIQQRANTDGVGVINAAVTAGGRSGGTKYCNTEEYDGASWSVGGALSTTAYTLGMSGTQNAALAAGGNLHGSPTSNDNTCVEVYNGVNWSSATSLTTGRMGAAVAGTQNSTFAADSTNPSFTGVTEEYNGSTWSKSGDLITNRGYMKGGGNTSRGIISGGCTPTAVRCTELYSGGTFHGTLSAWSAGGALINANQYHGSSGVENAGIIAGGDASPGACTEHYDGSTWAAGGTLIKDRTNGGMLFGSQNAAGIVGGYDAPTVTACFEKYNGYVWTKDAALNSAKRYNQSAGTQNAGITFGGYNPAGDAIAETETYDGTSWSEVADMNVCRNVFAGGGSQYSAWAVGGAGFAAPTATIAASGSMEHWDGTAWANQSTLNIPRSDLGGTGTQINTIVFGGRTPSTVSCTESHDGTAWTVETAMPLVTRGNAGIGVGGGAAVSTGGGAPSSRSCTDHFQRTHSGAPYILTKKIKAQE